MQFAIIAYDGTDEAALDRRIAARDAHIATSDKLVASGNGLFGGAILNDDGKMVGTIKIVEFETQAEFDEYWASEPYVTGEVWKSYEIVPFKTGPPYRNSR